MNIVPIYFDSPRFFLVKAGKEPVNAGSYYRAMGFTDIEPLDDFFYSARYPKNWTTEGDGYWVNVYDVQHRARFSFFCKRSPWDEDGFTRPKTRYTVTRDYPEYDPTADSVVQYHVKDGEKIIFCCDPVTVRNDSGTYPYDSEKARLQRCNFHDREQAEEERQRAICQKWLNQHYPKWKDILAYW